MERAERVDYWSNGVAINDWDLSQAPVPRSSVDLIYSSESSSGVDVSFEIALLGQGYQFLNDNIQVYDSTNLHQFLELTDYSSFDFALQQIFRHNETDRDMVMMLKTGEQEGLSTSQEKKLTLAPGFTREDYSFSPDGEINVNYSVTQETEGLFVQNITFGETGICVHQVIDFNFNTWSREILTDDCVNSADTNEWHFPQGYGPLASDDAFLEPVEVVDVDQVFQEGF